MSTWDFSPLTAERDELSDMLGHLSGFLSGARPPFVSSEQYGLLQVQEAIMRAYLGVLNRRLEQLTT